MTSTTGTWDVLPEVSAGEMLRRDCRAAARRRALFAAATSLIPIPGIDIATDLAVLTRLIKRINEHYGLSEAQIDALSTQRQVLAYRLLAAAGGTLAVRLTTPALLGRIVRVAGIRLTTMEAARFVPLAGQIVAAGIGYWSVKTVAMHHIAQCERVVAEMEASSRETLDTGEPVPSH